MDTKVKLFLVSLGEIFASMIKSRRALSERISVYRTSVTRH